MINFVMQNMGKVSQAFARFGPQRTDAAGGVLATPVFRGGRTRGMDAGGNDLGRGRRKLRDLIRLSACRQRFSRCRQALHEGPPRQRRIETEDSLGQLRAPLQPELKG